MPTHIFVNLPVADLQRSIAFFAQVGYTFNQQFTDDNATCMIIDEGIFAMLLVRPYFETFTPKPVANAHEVTEVLVALSAESRAAVDALVDRAIAAGGREAREAQDHGFMYGRAYEDLDGHIWEIFWMDQGTVLEPADEMTQ
ncbi:MAG: glyoxalase/bleomycin resistance/extradiol dioxygenase family protein [Actinobacteria bacterium]|uniref:Unannotated protein n=1 Tax=freshwater metagenome TaxID=449393 RepID=A0A6J7DCT7_9ZZZZ|nr:glyoxalase/bleomycin resistance/extradiol dioxygenase family protein [Actinomycetota bacterium]